MIHTGDVTVDGAAVEADPSYCAGLLNELGVRWRAVPGNHDFGDARHVRQPAPAERLALWRRYLGPDRRVEDVGGAMSGWRLIGIDAAQRFSPG